MIKATTLEYTTSPWFTCNHMEYDDATYDALEQNKPVQPVVVVNGEVIYGDDTFNAHRVLQGDMIDEVELPYIDASAYAHVLKGDLPEEYADQVYEAAEAEGDKLLVFALGGGWPSARALAAR